MDPTALLREVSDLATRDDRLAFRHLALQLELAFATGNLTAVNAALAHLDPARVGAFTATGALRCTFRARDLLPAWTTCRDATATWLTEHGQLELMRGLL